jgi:hypothetical protein
MEENERTLSKSTKAASWAGKHVDESATDGQKSPEGVSRLNGYRKSISTDEMVRGAIERRGCDARRGTGARRATAN